MHPPDEMMTQSFLPAMRQLVASRLRSHGLSQSRISAMLGITQASVSMYLSSKSEKAYDVLSRFSLSAEEADAKASQLADAVAKGAPAGLTAFYSIWTGILGSGSACDYHRSLHPSLADCDLCIREYGHRGGAIADVVAEVTEAVQMLEGSSHFVELMPEVSVNLACAAEGATSPGDVVAVPGRIVKVRGRPKAMLPPEAGASVHMSRILLLVRKPMPDLRACINIRYDSSVAAAMKRLRLRTLSIGKHSKQSGEDPTVEALERTLKTPTGSFNALVEEGGSGIEPNVYLFAKGAREAAELALRLARAYSAA